MLEDIFNSEKRFLLHKNTENEKEIQEIDNQIQKLEISISDSDDVLFQEIYQKKSIELRQRKALLLKTRDSDISYQKSEINEMLDFVLPILKTPYKLRSSRDPEIMQLIPGVVINTAFFALAILCSLSFGVSFGNISSSSWVEMKNTFFGNIV